MDFVFDDGGRAESGRKGEAGDCVCRAIAIVTGRPYSEIYARLAAGMGKQRASKCTKKRSASARNGVTTRRKWFKEYMTELGLEYIPTMRIGSGCKVHLTDGELPQGRLIVQVSKHYTTVIDGVIHDTWNPQRKTLYFKPNPIGVPIIDRVADRCVYGYWKMMV